jgi:small-conductance mechanosensitive channel
VLGNIIAGVQIAISRPIRVGDALDYEGLWCYVEEITYMYVLCCTWDEKRYVIPLRYFVSKPFTSYSLRDPHTLRTVQFKVDYTVDVEEIRKEFIRAVKDHELYDENYEPKVQVIDWDEETVTVRGVISAGNASDAWDLHCDMREHMLTFVQSRQRGALPKQRVLGEEGTPDPGLLDGG